MDAWNSRVRSLLAITAAAFVFAGCSGNGTSGVPATTTAGHSPIAPQAGTFRQASAADKSQSRPSIDSVTKTSQVKAQTTGGGGSTSRGSFTLVTSLAIVNDGTFSEPTTTCNNFILFAPWYWAEGSFSLPVADPTDLPVCTPPSRHRNSRVVMTQPFPSPLPTPTDTPAPIATNLYIIKVDIGFISLGITPISGPASISADGTTWSFPALVAEDSFKDDHLYAFFVASWSGTNPPPTINI